MVFIVAVLLQKHAESHSLHIFNRRFCHSLCFLPTYSPLKGPNHQCSIALSFMTQGNTVRGWGMLPDEHTQMTLFNHGTIEG